MRRTIGDYTVMGDLGRGSMGQVLLVRHRLDGKLFALKTPSVDTDTDDRNRELNKISFRNEARVGASVIHPNILRLHEFRLLGRQPYLVMDYVPKGRSLKRYRTEGRLLPVTTVIRIVSDCAMALGHVHAQGIVHRDIKPSNLLLMPDLTVKIADFGVAQFDDESHDTTVIVAGSPKYMSPEQIAQVPLTGQSDIFSLGIVLYELLAGQHPFRADALDKLHCNILTAEPAVMAVKFDGIDNVISSVLARALAKDPADRYRDAYAFASDLLLLRDMLKRHDRKSRRGLVLA